MEFEIEVRERLSSVEAGINRLAVMAAENNTSLKDHMRRTGANEERIQNLEKWLLGLLSAILVSVLAKLYF